MFLGRKKDLRKLATPLTRRRYRHSGEIPFCGQFAHIVRYSKIFVPCYPLFAEYLRNYRYFVNRDVDYRLQLVPHLTNDGFFWHVAHRARLDPAHPVPHRRRSGKERFLFYANNVNQNADWSRSGQPAKRHAL